MKNNIQDDKDNIIWYYSSINTFFKSLYQGCQGIKWGAPFKIMVCTELALTNILAT